MPKSARNINTPPSNDIDSYNAITVAPQNDDTGDTDDNGTDGGDHEGADGEDGSGASPLEKALMKTIAEKLLINPTRVNEKNEELYCYCNRVSFGDVSWLLLWWYAILTTLFGVDDRLRQPFMYARMGMSPLRPLHGSN